MFLKVTKDNIAEDGCNRKSAKFTDITRSLHNALSFHWQTHAKPADYVAEDGFFHNVLWKLNKR